MAIRPRDKGRFFDVAERRIALGAALTQICNDDSERVLLIVSVEVPTSSANVTTLSGAVVGQGTAVTQNERLVISDGEHGPLVQKAFYASAGAAINITVIEMFLRRYPVGEVP